MSFLFAPAAQAVLPVEDEPNLYFPVRRVFGIATNFGDYEGEKPEAKYFMKSPESIVITDAKEGVVIPYPSMTGKLRHEIELVVAIGKSAKNISPENAKDVIWGYAAGLDMTRADLRKDGFPWEASKTFEASAPMSAVRPKHRAPEPENLNLWLYVNNTLRQEGSTKQMIRSVPEIISELSYLWGLEPGDLIMTGTPKAPGLVNPGDTLRGGIEGVAGIMVTYEGKQNG